MRYLRNISFKLCFLYKLIMKNGIKLYLETSIIELNIKSSKKNMCIDDYEFRHYSAVRPK